MWCVAPFTGPVLTWPTIEGAKITQEFGANPQWFRWAGLDGHDGIDIAVPEGSPVYAVEAGFVYDTEPQVRLGEKHVYGLHIRLYHFDYDTIYAHLSEVYVESGEQVKRGQLIGLSGSSGNATGPHLHFGVKVDGKFVDPMIYFRDR